MLGVIEEKVGEDQEGENIRIYVNCCGDWWARSIKRVVYPRLNDLRDQWRGVPSPEVSPRKNEAAI